MLGMLPLLQVIHAVPILSIVIADKGLLYINIFGSPFALSVSVYNKVVFICIFHNALADDVKFELKRYATTLLLPVSNIIVPVVSVVNVMVAIFSITLFTPSILENISISSDIKKRFDIFCNVIILLIVSIAEILAVAPLNLPITGSPIV